LPDCAKIVTAQSNKITTTLFILSFPLRY
jgi:hypothetical protein